MKSEYAFVIMQVGHKGSPERRRADEVYKYVVTPALEKLSLAPYRSDLDATPGPINPQMLRKLLEARVVIADLTGRNPNVFYELGIVHSFARPVISLADRAQLLPFDTHDERVIELGDHTDALPVTQAEEGKAALARALEIVLRADYVPGSPVAEVAARRSLEQLAPENPIAAELAAIRGSLSAISLQLRQDRRYTGRWLASAAAREPLQRPLPLYSEGLTLDERFRIELLAEDDRELHDALTRILQHPKSERLLETALEFRRSASSDKEHERDSGEKDSTEDDNTS